MTDPRGGCHDATPTTSPAGSTSQIRSARGTAGRYRPRPERATCTLPGLSASSGPGRLHLRRRQPPLDDAPPHRRRSLIKHTQDFRGNEVTTIDEMGRTTSYTYDLAGQLAQTTYADGTFTTQTYDALGRLSSKTDERGNTTTYAYEPGCDCTDRLTSVTDPLGRTTSMTYDGMSRKTSMTDANSHQTSYAYDLRGHLIETDYRGRDCDARHVRRSRPANRQRGPDWARRRSTGTTPRDSSPRSRTRWRTSRSTATTAAGTSRRSPTPTTTPRRTPTTPRTGRSSRTLAAGHDRDVRVRRGEQHHEPHRLPREDRDVQLRPPLSDGSADVEDPRPEPGRADGDVRLQRRTARGRP